MNCQRRPETWTTKMLVPLQVGSFWHAGSQTIRNTSSLDINKSHFINLLIPIQLKNIGERKAE